MQPSPPPSPTPTPSSPGPAPRQVRVTDGAWSKYDIPKAKLNGPKTLKNLYRKNDAKPPKHYKSPPPSAIYEDLPESIAEFSEDGSLPLLFGTESRLSNIDEEDEEEEKAAGIEVKSAVPDYFHQIRRKETPIFGEEGGGERGFDVWRDQY